MIQIKELNLTQWICQKQYRFNLYHNILYLQKFYGSASQPSFCNREKCRDKTNRMLSEDQGNVSDLSRAVMLERGNLFNNASRLALPCQGIFKVCPTLKCATSTCHLSFNFFHKLHSPPQTCSHEVCDIPHHLVLKMSSSATL